MRRVMARKRKMGDRFERLEIIGEHFPETHRYWKVRCDCGTEKLIKARDWLAMQSCGCLRNELSARHCREDLSKHGMSRSPEYVARLSAIARCDDVNWRDYHRYGGRGISVCREWRDSFEAFLADVGPRPSSKHSLDRIDVNGNYEPGNVRWATAQEQGNNKRNTRMLSAFGRTQSATQWAREFGLRQSTLIARVDRGWSVEDAITKSVQGSATGSGNGGSH